MHAPTGRARCALFVVITLFLSPHLDDAVFSAGALIASLPPGSTAVATCFTATVDNPTGFALTCQTDKGYGPEVDYMALRRAEDQAACEILGAATLHLDLPEAPHRGYESADALFGEMEAADRVEPVLEERLRKTLAEVQPRTVCYPFGVGRHVDHQRVIDSTWRVRASFPGIRWIRWYDQPYVARHRRNFPELAFTRRVRGLVEVGDDTCAMTYEPVERQPEGPLARKVRAAAAYASQAGYQFGAALGLPPASGEELEGRIARVLGRREWFVA